MSNLVMFKSQLQEYAQKSSLPAPLYETIKEGPSHEPNFRSSVIVNGVRYDSPPGFRNRKTAEHAAAQVALQELVKVANGAGYVPNPVYETGLCKNLLQEYAQKLSLPVPSYRCVKIGEGHMSTFSCTVEIAGICYVGGPARGKKEAEIKAARTALLAIQAQACSSGPQVAFTSAITSQIEVYSGMKRERTSEQSSEAVKVIKPKRRKGGRKKPAAAKLDGSAGKEGTSLESSSKAFENGQDRSTAEETPAVNIKEEQKPPQQDISMKQDLGHRTEDQEKPVGGEMLAALGNHEQEKQGEDKIVATLCNQEEEKRGVYQVMAPLGNHEQEEENQKDEKPLAKKDEQEQHGITEDAGQDQNSTVRENPCVGTLIGPVGSS